MKSCLITVLFLSFSNLSWALDIRGAWYGQCVQNGISSESALNIRQDEKSINLGESDYAPTRLIGTTQSSFTEGVNEDMVFKEVKVYDWHLSEDKSFIVTNVHWLGWYVGQSGVWSGRGTGHIKKVGDQLEIQQDFEMDFGGSIIKTSEVCRYDKE